MKKFQVKLTGYNITTESGHNWSTSMAPDVTLEQAKKYFIGKQFDIGVYPNEKMEKVIKVESLN